MTLKVMRCLPSSSANEPSSSSPATKSLAPFLILRDAFSQFAKTAYGKVVGFVMEIAHGQTKVAVGVAALFGRFDLAVMGGVADQVDGYLLIVQR